MFREFIIPNLRHYYAYGSAGGLLEKRINRAISLANCCDKFKNLAPTSRLIRDSASAGAAFGANCVQRRRLR